MESIKKLDSTGIFFGTPQSAQERYNINGNAAHSYRTVPYAHLCNLFLAGK